MAKTKSPDYEQLLYNKKPEAEAKSQQWWDLKDTDMPSAIEAIMKSLYDAQSRRQQQLVVSTRLYGNLNLMGVAGLPYARVSTNTNTTSARVTYNVCSSTVDTVSAKIAKNKPKPYFLTQGGDYKLKKKAEKLGKFIDGCFYTNRMYELGPIVFRDASVWGDGCIHVYSENGQIKSERQMISELYVDEVEGVYGYPRQLYRVKNVDRLVLAAKFPKHKEAIMTASRAQPDVGGIQNLSDQLTVTEAWHLRSGDKAKDGKHAITIAGATLFSEEYQKDHFPFAFLKWNKRLYGFYGQGLVEQIQNIQLEINKLLWVIQRSMHLAGSFKILLENGSKIVSEKLSNDIGALIRYTGTEPKYITPPIVPAEIYNHLMTLKNAAYEQAGVSQLSAASKKPDGLNSGRALREFNDIESDRFMLIGQAYEQLFLDVARLMIEEAKECYEEDRDFYVITPGKKFIETIRWKDVNMDDDQYVLKAFPVSKLPTDPAGLLDTVKEYMEAGLMSPQTGRRLLDNPDLEAEESLANAQEEYLHKVLDNIEENGEDDYEPPEPTDNLDLAEKLAIEYISRGKCEGVEPEKLDMYRTFLSQVQLLKLKAATPPEAGSPGGPPALPTAPANPGPTPTSPLLNASNTPTPAI